jgi:hypothetical protein
MNGGSGGENILKSKPLSNNTQAPEGRMYCLHRPSNNAGPEILFPSSLFGSNVGGVPQHCPIVSKLFLC